MHLKKLPQINITDINKKLRSPNYKLKRGRVLKWLILANKEKYMVNMFCKLLYFGENYVMQKLLINYIDFYTQQIILPYPKHVKSLNKTVLFVYKNMFKH